MFTQAIERIRDFLVSQIKALRSPNINAQIIQQRAFVAYKDLYIFLAKHHAQLADEIAQAYINTMRWYYLSHFTRYRLALEKIPLYIVDKHDGLGDQTNQRGVSFNHEFYNLPTNRSPQVPPPKVPNLLTTLFHSVDVLKFLSAPLPLHFPPM